MRIEKVCDSIEEFLGEFDAVFNEKKYEQWKKTTWFISHARRRLRYMFFHKKNKA